MHCAAKLWLCHCIRAFYKHSSLSDLSTVYFLSKSADDLDNCCVICPAILFFLSDGISYYCLLYYCIPHIKHSLLCTAVYINISVYDYA